MRRAALTLLLSVGLGSGVAEASPEDVFGFGARTSGMGATGPAVAHGYESVYANPALLSTETRRELTFGVTGAVFDLHAGKRDISYSPTRGTVVGAVLPLPFGGFLRDRIAIGLGVFTPFELVARARILYPETQQFLLPDRTQSIGVQAGIGIDVGYGIRIGGGFAALAALTGDVLVATDSSGRIGTVVENSLVASYGPIVGASYDIGEAYRIGATFRGELVGRFNVVINVRDLGSITVPPLNISGIAQYDPAQLSLEVARHKGAWKAAVGATYKHWSAYPGPTEATVRCPSTDPMTGMPFAGPCLALKPAKMNYSDTVSPHVGVERTFGDATDVAMSLRAGAFFEPSPAPEQTKEANQYDESRVALTLGYGIVLGDSLFPVQFDAFGQLQVLVPRTHEKGKGVPGSNPGAPKVDAGGTIGAFGLTAGVRF